MIFSHYIHEKLKIIKIRSRGVQAIMMIVKLLQCTYTYIYIRQHSEQIGVLRIECVRNINSSSAS